jgi:hypothetical protein
MMPARTLDDPGRDRPAGFEGLVVAQVLALAGQVADARVGAVPSAPGEPGGIGLSGDAGGGPVAVAGQDGEGLENRSPCGDDHARPGVPTHRGSPGMPSAHEPGQVNRAGAGPMARGMVSCLAGRRCRLGAGHRSAGS